MSTFTFSGTWQLNIERKTKCVTLRAVLYDDYVTVTYSRYLALFPLLAIKLNRIRLLGQKKLMIIDIMLGVLELEKVIGEEWQKVFNVKSNSPFKSHLKLRAKRKLARTQRI